VLRLSGHGDLSQAGRAGSVGTAPVTLERLVAVETSNHLVLLSVRNRMLWGSVQDFSPFGGGWSGQAVCRVS